MPTKQKIVIGIIGSSSVTQEEDLLAQEVGKRLAKEGVIIICGGLGGVMESSCRGAKEASGLSQPLRAGAGLTIGILPGTSVKDANPYIDIPIPTGIGEARNLIIIRTSSSLIAIGGGYGTLSEIAFALKLGAPVIGLKTWELEKISLPGLSVEGLGKKPINIYKVKTAEEAVAKAIELAKKHTR